MPGLVRVQLLGRFQAKLEGGETAVFRTSRAAEVVARLIVQRGGRLPRAALAQELWPDSDPVTQLKNLRPALSYARSALGESAIRQADGDILALGSIESDWDDAIRRERLTLSQLPAEERINSLLRLDYQIQKPLLSGWESEWILPYRDFHERRRLDVLRSLAEEFGAKGDWEAALEFASRMLEVDPLSEQGLRWTLRCLSQLGRNSEGVQVFKTYRAQLKAELGLQVSTELREYARAILSRGPEAQHKPITLLQQEFILGLISNLLETDPARLLTLLASPSLNWDVVRHGPELLPFLEQALERAPAWSEDRAGVIKRLLMCYHQFGNWAGVQKYSTELYAQGTANDRIAALNYRGMRALELGQYEDGFAAYEEALDLAIKSNHTYYKSVTQCNLARLLTDVGRAHDALVLVRAEYDSLAKDQSMAGKYASAQHMFLHLEVAIHAGELEEARTLLEKLHVFTEANGLGRLYEQHQIPAALLSMDEDPEGAADKFCRGIEAVLPYTSSGRWVAPAALAIHGLGRLGRPQVAERLARILQASATAAGLNISPAISKFLPPLNGQPPLPPMSGPDLLHEIREELRRV